MRGRIITARHGRPSLSREMTISAQEYGPWWAAYDDSGLHPDEAPPASLVALGKAAHTVVSSPLPRAVETARHVTGGAREVPADPLFVEAPLPPPPVPFLKLRPGWWGVISRFYWSFGYAPDGVEHVSDTWKRVDQVIDRLIDLSARGDVLLCAHGFLNWMIDRRLRKRGWRREAHEGGNHYWSWRIYTPPASRALESADGAQWKAPGARAPG